MKEKWDKKYFYALRNWKNTWSELRTFFKFSPEIRRIMLYNKCKQNLSKSNKNKKQFFNRYVIDEITIFINNQFNRKMENRLCKRLGDDKGTIGNRI